MYCHVCRVWDKTQLSPFQVPNPNSTEAAEIPTLYDKWVQSFPDSDATDSQPEWVQLHKVSTSFLSIVFLLFAIFSSLHFYFLVLLI